MDKKNMKTVNRRLRNLDFMITYDFEKFILVISSIVNISPYANL
jgi:hypothetical protein